MIHESNVSEARSRVRGRGRSVAAAVLALGVGLTSSATAEDSVIEEVVVTATKRSASIQDVPFSINAQTESDIERTGASSIEDLEMWPA